MKNRHHRSAALLLGLATATPFAATAQQPPAPQPGRVETMQVDAPLLAWDRLGGVTVDALGYVYTTAFAEEVFKIAPDGSVELLATGFYGASGNAMDRNGDLLQSDFFSNTIHRISRTGEVSLVTDENLSGPVGIAVATDGSLFVTSCGDNTIVRVRRDGTATKFAEGDLFSCPNGITFDDRGDLYVVNFNDDRLIRIDGEGNAESVVVVEPPNGWPQRALDMGVRGNAHIAFVNGSFYVTKIKSNSLWRIDRDDMSAELFAGNYQYGLEDGALDAASFAAPNGIAAYRNVLYINNHSGVWQQLDRAELVMRKVFLPQ